MCEEGIFLINEAVETGQKEYEIEKHRNSGTEKTEREREIGNCHKKCESIIS